ncbi:ROK family protein [Promineifilum sp.]|uniref:ROK family transcriptional regulator n=1 Tax=Promineifilum sp. TaxID=2664178 RepID=UPI0035B3F8BA
MANSPAASTPVDASTLLLEPLEAAIVAAIRGNGPLSRTDLSAHLDYSRASVTGIVGRMVGAGILAEVGEGKSAGGRRPFLLDINPDLGYVVGVDIGATSVDVALADFRGRILERIAQPADVRGRPDEFLGCVADLIGDLLARRGTASTAVMAVGVGVPGPVEFAPGVLIAPPLMPLWEGFPIKDFLRARFPMARVAVDNDVNIMARGECQAGAGKGLENFLFIKIGTGIGCGIITNGQVYHGADGAAGDVGHICVDYNGPVCHCGNQGCLEIMAAGPAIAARARARAEAGESDFLAARLAERGMLSAVDVGDAAAAGDRAANEIIRQSGRMIGGVLATLVNFYNPEAVFIGGGVSQIGHVLLSSIRQATLRRATALSTRRLRIEYSRLGEDAGVIGGIWLALENAFTIK